METVLHQLLERAAQTSPDAPAVIDGTRCLSYGELSSRANQLAHLLIELGVRRGDRVALYLDKSVESVVGVHGILTAGAGYVPLDPDGPRSRLAYVTENCGARWLVSSATKADRWAELVHHGAPIEHVIVLEEGLRATAGSHPVVHTSEALDGQPPSPPAVRAISADLAYILYTSGSTGVPKGVTLSHRNALAFVDWATRTFGVTSQDRLSSHAPLHFDLSVFDLFAAASAAAAVVLVPPQASVFPRVAARFVADARISVWYSVPSILSMIVLRGGLMPGAWPDLRVVLFAGEVFPTKHLRALMSRVPHARFANLYGPTETNVCTWYEVTSPPDGDEDVPIGRAIDDDEVVVVGPDEQPVPPGTPGELYVRGATVMQGYWGDEERTARSLIDNPWNPQVGDPVYRTGDLVCELPDGNLRFLGRRDAQIKSRGYRVELGEIETALNAHPLVAECAVVAVPDELVTNRILAHVVAGDGRLDDAELLGYCRERLPSYMIPEAFVVQDALPRTSTGKVDRRALLPTGR